jgi:PAS domain S-box-containing protein
LFLVYVSIQYYRFENQRLVTLTDDISVVKRSAMVNKLIDVLQEERRFSFENALKKDDHINLAPHRRETDSVISFLENDSELKGFTKYTMLDGLAATRAQVDARKLGTNGVMNYYTTAIFRISMLEVTPQFQIPDAQALNHDIHSARALSQVITYLGILRANIYNVLFTRQYQFGNGTLMGLFGVYQVYTTYQTEFIATSPRQQVAAYQKIMQEAPIRPVVNYLSNSFKTMQFDSVTYTDVEWWKRSGYTVEKLRALQNNILKNVDTKLTTIIHAEKVKVNRLMLLLLFALVLSTGIITLTIISITRTLTELRVASEKIAAGATGISLNIESEDVIGKLAMSVSLIDDNNILLAEAADEIRRGNFNVGVNPRGDSDILGNSLLQMKNELQHYTKEQLANARELERLLAAVKASESHFRQIADQTPFMIWQTNDKGEAVYVNKQWIAFTGLSFDDSLGMGWATALHPDDVKERQFIKAFANKVSFRSKARFRNADNEYRWTLIQGDPTTDNGVFKGYVGSLTDISDQVAAQEAVVELMNKKDEFLTIASHELKTPLTSIKAYNQLLKKTISADSKSFELASKSLLHIERLEKLIKDLLDMSRINSGQMVYDDEAVDFDELLHHTIESFSIASGRHKVIIETSASAQINGDRVRIEQVINNLLNNAAKYSPDADKIFVNTSVKDGYLTLSIKDFGIGIEGKDIEMLFDKFYRTEKNFYKFQGLGLGLFISNEIITRHRGKIWAQSKPGEGSTFYIKLPVV